DPDKNDWDLGSGSDTPSNNSVGGTETVTAKVTTTGGAAVQGATVTFLVTAGPNKGRTGTDVSDANGQATFTYTDTGGAGTDTIVVSTAGLPSKTLTKTWAA